jgi:hypothetical protein
MFNIINRNSPEHWAAIRELVTSTEGPLVASQNHPEGLPFAKWAQNLGVLRIPSAEAGAEAVVGSLGAPEPPRVVMLDDLRMAAVEMIRDLARIMRDRHPELAGRWGVYVANGPGVGLDNYGPAIAELLRAGATLAVEMYPRYADYCGAGWRSAGRDRWLAAYFRGGGPFPRHRLDWLMAQRDALGSPSRVTAVFGVTDKGRRPGTQEYLRGRRPAEFLDRIFEVWMTGSGHPELLAAANGGAGSYKWDRDAVSDPSRAGDFVASWRRHCEPGAPRGGAAGRNPCG